MEILVKQFNEKFRSPLDPNTRMLDIQSEVGELSKEVIKCEAYGTKPFEKNENLELEVGDVLYSIISFALENGIDPKVAVEKVIEKYKKRFEEKGHIGSNN